MPSTAQCILNLACISGTALCTPLTQTGQCVQELGALWERILDGLQGNDAPGTAQNILTFAYFWYNFMPLARGTAAAGYIFILSMFLAAGMPVSASIPKVRRLH